MVWMGMLIGGPITIGVCMVLGSTAVWSYCSGTVLLVLIGLALHTIGELPLSTLSGSRYAMLATSRILHVMLSGEMVWAPVVCGVCVYVLGSGMHILLFSSTSSLYVVVFPLVVCYVVGSAAETSLHPYDVLECEPELVSGYYVDYGAVGFMVIYLGEGIAMSSLLVTLVWMVCSTGAALPLLLSCVL